MPILTARGHEDVSSGGGLSGDLCISCSLSCVCRQEPRTGKGLTCYRHGSEMVRAVFAIFSFTSSFSFLDVHLVSLRFGNVM